METVKLYIRERGAVEKYKTNTIPREGDSIIIDGEQYLVIGSSFKLSSKEGEEPYSNKEIFVEIKSL